MSQIRFHIGDDGLPAECRAKKRVCPKTTAGDPFHGTYEEAMAESTRRFSLLETPPLKKVEKRKYEDSVFGAVREGMEGYFNKGARSPSKIIPIHSKIATDLQEAGLYVVSKGVFPEDKELKVEGDFYSKDCDISIVDKEGLSEEGTLEEGVVSVVEVKFVTTNYTQNANNYLEGGVGATANLQRNGIDVAQFIIIPAHIPYLKKDGTVDRVEVLSSSHIEKYARLMSSEWAGDSATPRHLCFSIADVWNKDKILKDKEKGEVKLSRKYLRRDIKSFDDYDALKLSEVSRDFLAKHSDYDNFIENFAKKTKEKIEKGR